MFARTSRASQVVRNLARHGVRKASTNANAPSTASTWASLAFMGGAGAAIAYALAQNGSNVAQASSGLEDRVKQIEIELSNNRNRAYVFIKPHAG